RGRANACAAEPARGHVRPSPHAGGARDRAADRGPLSPLRLLPRDRRGVRPRPRVGGARPRSSPPAAVPPGRGPRGRGGGRPPPPPAAPPPACPSPNGAPVARGLWAMAGVEPVDIDVVQLYENFTGMVLMMLEDFGFCARGEGGPFAEDGKLAWPDGALPFN